MHSVVLETSDGPFRAYFSESGLQALDFPKPGGVVKESAGATRPPAVWIALTHAALRDTLAAKTAHALPPFDLSQGTEFQQKVWRGLLAIPVGKTLTYLALAEAIGHPKAVRAVGGACGANPIPVLIPCHRVVAAHGLGGFSSGLDWKRKLLQREGVLQELI